MADLKIIVDSGDVVDAKNRVNQLDKSVNTLGKKSQNAGNQQQVLGKRANRAGVLAQQAGYQFGDFAVQVQSGTNPMVAFGQQATQLIGTFSMLAKSTKMIGIFAGLGVLIPVMTGIGAAMMRTRGELKSFNEELTNTTELIGEYTSLKDNFGGFGEGGFAAAEKALQGTSSAYRDLITLAKFDAINSIKGSLDALAVSALNTNWVLGEIGEIGNLLEIETQLQGNITVFKNNREQANLFRQELIALGEATSLEDQYSAAIGLRDSFLQIVGPMEDMNEEQAIFYKGLLESIYQMEVLGAATKAVGDANTQALREQRELSREMTSKQTDRLALAMAERDHGKDSVEYARLRAEQEGISKGLVEGSLQRYIDLEMVIRDVVTQTEAAAAAEERRVAAIQVFYAYQAQLLDQQQQRQAGVDAIADAMAKETGRLNNQISLNQKIAQFGEDSVEVAEERATQAREAYAQSLMDQKILGSNLRTQMDAYDLGVQEAKLAKERIETDRKRAALEAHTTDQQERLALAKAELDHGKESFEVAELRAEQEGIAKGYTDAALQSYIDTEMVIRDIVEATEASTRNAAEFAKVDISAGVRAAAEAAQRLATHLGISLRSAMAMQGMISTRITGDVFDPRDPRNQGSDAALERTRRIMEGGSLTDSLIPDESGGGGSDPFDQKAYLDSLQDEANFKESLVGINDEAVANMERRREITKRIEDEGLVADEERILNILLTEAATRKAIDAEEQRQATFDKVSGHIESAFMAMVDGSKSVEDAFKGMIRSILLDVYQQAVAKPMANALTSFLGFKDGGAFSNGNVIPFANGGVVSSATMFPMAGNQTGVMGEAGPEAIMPLKRGANGKLGVQVQGGGGENVVIHQNFNFQANGDDSVKRIIAQAAPQIANMTKKSMMDDRRRGGQMKATFG